MLSPLRHFAAPRANLPPPLATPGVCPAAPTNIRGPPTTPFLPFYFGEIYLFHARRAPSCCPNSSFLPLALASFPPVRRSRPVPRYQESNVLARRTDGTDKKTSTCTRGIPRVAHSVVLYHFLSPPLRFNPLRGTRMRRRGCFLGSRERRLVCFRYKFLTL